MAGAGYWVIFRAGDGVRATLEETTAPLVGFVSSGFAWARDHFSGAGLLPLPSDAVQLAALPCTFYHAHRVK